MRAALGTILATLTVLVGCPAPQKPVEPTPPPQIISFSANPARAEAGQPVTLSWETRNAVSVELRSIDGGTVAGASDLTGTVQVSIAANALFILVATNSAGVKDTATAWVEVDEGTSEVLFGASPGQIKAGESAILAWHAAGGSKVDLAVKGGAAVDLGGQLESGSVLVTPAVDTTWVLTVDGKTWETTVAVSPTVDLLRASPESALPGQSLTVFWHTVGANKVTLSLAGVGQLHSETDPGRVADGSFEYLVPADIDPAAVLSFGLQADGSSSTLQTLQVYVAGAPRVRTWNVPRYAVTGQTFTLQWLTTGADVVEVLRDGLVVHRSPTAALAGQGTLQLPSPDTDTQLQLRASNTRGGVDLSEVLTVSPVGVPDNARSTFTATPQSGTLNGGDKVTLSWNVPEARHVEIVAKQQYAVQTVTGVAAESGSLDVYPNKNTVYELSADNGAGTVGITPLNVSVTVATPAGLVYSPPFPVPGTATSQLTGTSVPNSGDLFARNFAVKNRPSDAFIDISTTGTPIPFPVGVDADSVVVDLPEPFQAQWGDVKVGGRQVCVSNNGWMLFRASPLPQLFPPNLKGTIAVFGPSAATPTFPGDLQYHWLGADSNSRAYWQFDGTGAQARLIVQWSDIPKFLESQKRMTAQAQIYANGEVVLAYQNVAGWAQNDLPKMGVDPVDYDPATWITVDSTQLNGLPPVNGDRFAFFAKLPLPYAFPASSPTMKIAAVVGNGLLRLEGTPTLVPAGQVSFTEAMVTPPTGSTNGEWLEITNATTTPFDLNNWDIDFGNGSKHTISSSVIVPASGRVVLGQASNSAGTATVNYVYGPGYSLPKNGTPVILSRAGGTYASLGLPFGTVKPGYALQKSSISGTGVQKPSTVTSMVCTAPSTSSYTSGGYGTPGAANPACPEYTYSSTPITGAFEALATNGGTRVIPSGTSDSSLDPVTLITPVRFGGRQFSTIYVGTNGFVTLAPLTCPATSLSCYATNPTSINSGLLPVGAIAPFWSDLDLNSGGGIYWARRTPNIVPNDGYTVVSWENATRRNTNGEVYSLNFQIKFFDTGNIEFHYGTMSGTGGIGTSGADNAKGLSATSWMEVPEGGIAYVVNNNSKTPGITASAGYRFTAK